MADALWDVRLAPRVRRVLELVRDKGVRSLRVATSGGEFRVLYILHEADRCVLVAMIGPRKDVYDLLKRSELVP
jgi:mRNA-degrading endonuclease RelE of RelBE toxin-antitoxin system